MEHEQRDDFVVMDNSETPKVCNLSTVINCSERIALHDGAPEAVIVPMVFTVILLAGVIGNTLLILSFAKHKTLSTPHNALVVNLASGDFIFLIVSLPFKMVLYTLPNWPFGFAICKLSIFAESLATAVTISTLSILSVERCLIVTGKKLWRQQKRGPIWLTITIWVISLLVSLPVLVSANLHETDINNETYTFCFDYNKSWGLTYIKVHVAFNYIFLFCIPLLVISTAYIIIAVHLLLRAFPHSQRNIRTHKPKPEIRLRCFGSKKTTSVDGSESHGQTGGMKKVNNSVLKDDVNSTIAQGKTAPIQQPVKSNSSPGKDNCKSCSPDSFTEITELQQTPVLPYSFVYTGPISADAISTQEAIYNKLKLSGTGEIEKKECCSTSSMPWKETTPLNLPSNGEIKPGYQQRQQSLVTKRRRLAMTVLMLIIAFAVCWMPRHVYLIWHHFHPEDYNTFWHVFKIIGFCLCSSNSAVNPVVFYILDTTYRSFVHRALCKFCLKKCQSKRARDGEPVISLGERDYNATIAMSDMKSKGHMTEL